MLPDDYGVELGLFWAYPGVLGFGESPIEGSPVSALMIMAFLRAGRAPGQQKRRRGPVDDYGPTILAPLPGDPILAPLPGDPECS